MSVSTLVAALLLATFLVLGVDGARRDTPTVDEFAHLPAGCAALRHGSLHLYATTPPLARMWMAAPVVLGQVAVPPPPAQPATEWQPWLYGSEFLSANREGYLRAYFLARLAVLVLALAGGVIVYAWARRLYGATAAVGAVFLYTFCPNLQAHGRLATVDVAFSTAALATFFCLDHYGRRPGRARLLVVGCMLGLALLTKFTAVLILPVVLVLLVGIAWSAGTGSRGGFRRVGVALGQASLRFAALGAVALVVVNLGYRMRDTLAPLGSFHWQSGIGRMLGGALPATLPVPLPRDFVAGFDTQNLVTERGEFGCYFRGAWSPRCGGIQTLAVLVLKLPVPMLALIVWTIASLRRRRRPLLDEALCWLFPITVLLAFGFFSALDLGIRYLLPILPFLYLAGARLLAGTRLFSIRGGVLAVCGVALVITTVRTHPHQLSYFNLLAGGSAAGHRWLIDSNLDWGQDLAAVRPYMEAHDLPFVYLLYFGHVEPEIYGIRYALPRTPPRPGTYVVSVNFVKGHEYVAPAHWRTVRVDGAPAWLRGATPVDRIGYSLWVYRVP
jgi:hypothetical protein